MRVAGNATASSLPLRARLSTIGPPGYPSPSSFATLSYASPAASSRVRPDALVRAGLAHHIQARVAARHHERDQRQCDVAVLEKQRLDVAREVVHRHERAIERKRQRLGERHADEQRTDESGPLRHGDRVEVFSSRIGGHRAPRAPRRRCRGCAGATRARAPRLPTRGGCPPATRRCSSRSSSGRRSATTAADVSSHDVSMPSINMGQQLRSSDA